MKIHYDQHIDALYIQFSDAEMIESEEIQTGVIHDFNENNQVVGIEILNFKVNLPKANLNQLEVEGFNQVEKLPLS